MSSIIRDDVLDILRASPLFYRFGDGELREIAGEFDDQRFLANHRIVSEGLTGMEFFIIVEGTATVLADDRPVAHLEPGDFFGEVASLDDGPRTATVRADTSLRCLGLPNSAFKDFLVEHPLFAVNMLHAVVRRLRAVMTSAS